MQGFPDLLLILHLLFVFEADHLTYRAGHQLISLRYIRKELASCLLKRDLLPVKFHITLAFLWMIKPHQKAKRSAFPAAGMTGNGNIFAPLHFKIKVAQHEVFFLSVFLYAVGKINMVEPQRRKGLCPLLIGCRSDIRLGFHETLGAGQHGIIPGKNSCNIGDR